MKFANSNGRVLRSFFPKIYSSVQNQAAASALFQILRTYHGSRAGFLFFYLKNSTITPASLPNRAVHRHVLKHCGVCHPAQRAVRRFARQAGQRSRRRRSERQRTVHRTFLSSQARCDNAHANTMVEFTANNLQKPTLLFGYDSRSELSGCTMVEFSSIYTKKSTTSCMP